MVRPRSTPAHTIARRSFLQSAGVAALGAPLVFSPFVQRHAYTCVVIGAGLSGLAAANVLKQGGWNVIVLEARERIGGRVLSSASKKARN